VTVKQVLDAYQAHPDAEFRIDGVEVGQVFSLMVVLTILQLTLVATIRTVNVQSTNVSYRMEDGTGMIEVKQWIDSDRGGNEAALPYCLYYRVC
jgi:replication factor A2